MISDVIFTFLAILEFDKSNFAICFKFVLMFVSHFKIRSIIYILKSAFVLNRDLYQIEAELQGPIWTF